MMTLRTQEEGQSAEQSYSLLSVTLYSQRTPPKRRDPRIAGYFFLDGQGVVTLTGCEMMDAGITNKSK